MIAAPGLKVPIELRARLADLYCAYSDVLDEGELESWSDFFTEDCLYKVMPRENFEQGLPIALIYCESRNMLADGVVAFRETALFVPWTVRHLTGNIRLRAVEPESLRLTANFALFQTMTDQPSEVSCATGTMIAWSMVAAACALPKESAFMIRRLFRSRLFTPYSEMRGGLAW